MSGDQQLSGVFIGGQSLLVQCAERFAANGHSIRAVVSMDPAARRWAQERNIAVLDTGPNLAARLGAMTFDYLFSVVHLELVPVDVLALPRSAAINFHDGPLPAYAGLNVTSWALMNQEREHGICWHVMEPQVDRGDVLVDVRFEIDDEDTALTVNAKCYEAALKSFGSLLNRLENGTVQRTAQNTARFGYYGRNKRPADAAVIDWSKSADEIVALVRGLQFGPYANPLAEPKVWINSTPVVVRRATVLPVPSTLAPGTISGVAADSVTVATSDLDVNIAGFCSLTGHPIDIRSTLAAVGVNEYDVLDPLGPELSEAVTNLHGQACRHEDFWAKRLQSVEPVDVPYAGRRTRTGDDVEYLAVEFEVPVSAGGESSDVHVLSGLLAYLGRIGRKECFDVMFRDAAGGGLPRGVEALFASYVPLHVEFNNAQSFSEFQTAVATELATLQNSSTYLLDLPSRRPDLTAAAEQWHDEPATVAIDMGGSTGSSERPTGADLIVRIGPDGSGVRWEYRTDVYDEATIRRMHVQLSALLGDAVHADRTVGELSILSAEEARVLQDKGQETAREYQREACVHELFEAQVMRTPHSKAVVFRDSEMTYAELDASANRVANYLLGPSGVRPGSLVGVMMDRSDRMLVGLMAVLKAGCAYVPLDPEYPSDRLGYMIEDSGLTAILTESPQLDHLPKVTAEVVTLDTIADRLDSQSTTKPVVNVQSSDLAYVIYTSGSTGKPKGVMVEHRNVVNFFAGMDERLDHDEPGTWLAVTSISFDISVLELFWTLARGFEVVLYGGEDKAASVASLSNTNGNTPELENTETPIDFSLFYFASDESEKGRDKYALLLDGAAYADANGFSAVWTPERHFHAFGGLYPNPAVASAAIAAITDNVQIRAGSCVLPLHNPIRIAEEWALVDNLSNGRVGISFAAGWQPNDFVISPDTFETRNQSLYEGIETVRALWRGETLAFDGPKGSVDIQTLPRPVQPELPCWVTAAGNPETFRMAGEIGANMLTHLLGQSVEELADKIQIYRDAWHEAGHEGSGYVSLMLHTFVSDDESYVREHVEEPMKNYLRTATDLVKKFASSFPAFRHVRQDGPRDIDGIFRELSDEDMDALLTHAFHRYYETSGLFGTPDGCIERVDHLKGVGVDEIACLIDFGCPSDMVLQNLPWLNELREAATPSAHVRGVGAVDEYTIPALMEKHDITHLQCTPSMATMLTKNARVRERLRSLKNMMVGGEAFPTELASDLMRIVDGRVLNMYGPTETTIWSSTHQLHSQIEKSVPLGKPIANTQIYILDDQLQPLPDGVPGELVIGGDGVVRGYLNREELTSERFVPNCFLASEAERMYRTGDLARRLPDGTLEFLGRIDNQVKVRGYRIELGEIEATLAAHPQVQEAVVVAREDFAGEQRLVGYVVADGGASPSVGALRDFLEQSLPGYMVPGTFVTLDRFPLTPNKKVDRRALPAPDQSRPELSEAFVAPMNPTEQTIAKLWSEALAVDEIGVNDNFIELGGDSLSAVEIFLRIGDEFNVEFPLHVFFQVPTIAGLTAELESMMADREGNLRRAAV